MQQIEFLSCTEEKNSFIQQNKDTQVFSLLCNSIYFVYHKLNTYLYLNWVTRQTTKYSL